jgi:hypothetical protein
MNTKAGLLVSVDFSSYLESLSQDVVLRLRKRLAGAILYRYATGCGSQHDELPFVSDPLCSFCQAPLCRTTAV